MMMRVVCILSALLATASSAWCQKWEFGGGVGGGFYTSQTVTNATAGSGNAKIGSGLSASAWLGNNSSDRWGGELRYDYQRGSLNLTSGSGSASFGAMSHTIHYDVHLHFAPREASIRPFVAFGGGIKMFQGTGQEIAAQPLSRIALLSKTVDTRPVISAGAGVKARLGERWLLRAGVWDFVTPFPNKVIVPNIGTTVSGGWMHDFVPMIGLSYIF
jgi:Outer membrane protein beta-barrel domain